MTTQAEAQAFFDQIAASASPEEQKALIAEYAGGDESASEMLAAVVQANPAAAQQIATATAQAIPEQAAEMGQAAAKLVANQQGATRRTVDILSYL